jgi:hypothetical protein
LRINSISTGVFSAEYIAGSVRLSDQKKSGGYNIIKNEILA